MRPLLTMFAPVRCFAVLTLALACGAAAARDQSPLPPLPPPASLDALQRRLAEIITQPRHAAAQWGAEVVSLDTGRTWFQHNARSLLKPASNNKLYTGALALDRLGPDFRIRTSLYALAKPDENGVLAGDVIVYGRGDPTFAARFNGGNYTNLPGPLAEALAAAGVREIQGDLIGDESFFRGPRVGMAWTWDDLQYYYGAEVSALSVQDNVVDVFAQPGPTNGAPCRLSTLPAANPLIFLNRTETVAAGGPRELTFQRPFIDQRVLVTGTLPLGGARFPEAVAVADPAAWFVSLLQESLARRGVRVRGGRRTMNWLDRLERPLDFSRLVELGHTESPPLAEIVTKMMKPSQNLYAQLLLLQVGARTQETNRPGQTTEDAGLLEMNRFLRDAGLAPGEALLEEGAGLSRGALLTPHATVTLLAHMSRHRHAEIFRDALPVAGVDGTLRTRLLGTPAEGNARAKTGSLRYVNTLSGYVATKAGERLVFSFMLNNYRGDVPGRADLDALVALLAGVEAKF